LLLFSFDFAAMDRLTVAATAELQGVFGAEFHRHNNLHRIDDETVLYAVGNAVRIQSECS
jgi:hypothetical protein